MPHFRLLFLATIACLWCGILLAVRLKWSGQPWFFFMVWNLFLAAVPLGFSLSLHRIRRDWLAAPVLAAWLLFFPNAPYVLTDLMHLKEHGGVPLWFDLLLLLSFALVALWMGFQSLRLVQDWVTWRTSSPVISWIFVCTTLMLSGFGIYLGRFLRWNSWDIFSRPHLLIADFMHRLGDPATMVKIGGVTFGFGGMLLIAYVSWTLTHPILQPATAATSGKP
jgi:uncharacterized membrane protein